MTRLTLLFLFLLCGCFSITSYGQEYTEEPEIDLDIYVPEIEETTVHGMFDNIRQFSVTGLPGANILPCNCLENANNNRYLYFWKFGDGSYSTEANPIHQYDLPGDYSVQVEVTPIYTEDEDIDRIRDDHDNPEQPGDLTGANNDSSDFDPATYDPTVYNKVIELVMDGTIELTSEDNFYIRSRNNSYLGSGPISPINLSNHFYNRDARPGNPMTLVTTVPTGNLYNITFNPAKLKLEHYDVELAENQIVDISGNLSISGCTCEKKVFLERVSDNDDYTEDDYRLYISDPVGSDCDFDTENIFINFRVNEDLVADEIVIHEDAIGYITDATGGIDLGFKVVSSFDPNEKSVDKEVIYNTSEHLTYTIDFQNYGLAPARDIKIVEQIPEHLDIESIIVESVVVGAEYDEENGVFNPSTLDITNSPQISPNNGNGSFWYTIDTDERTIKFYMDEVHLVGLGDNPEEFCGAIETQGQLVYHINTKASAFDDVNISFGTSADIYFDANVPVTTNATNTKYIIDSTFNYNENTKCFTYDITDTELIEEDISSVKRDVTERPNGSLLTSGYLTSEVGSEKRDIGLKFTGFSDIPENALITNAYIELTSMSHVKNPHDLIITFEDKLSPQDFVTTKKVLQLASTLSDQMLVEENHDAQKVVAEPLPMIPQLVPMLQLYNYHNLSGRDMLPFYKVWDAPILDANTAYQIDVKDFVQVIVSKDGWDNSNGSFVVKASKAPGPTSPTNYYSRDMNSSYAPRLIIEYQEPLSFDCKQGGEEKVLTKEISLSAYPNPATVFIQLEFDAAPTNGHIELFNLQGQSVIVEPISQGSTAHHLELKGLVRGVYLVRLTSGTKSSVQKIIIE